MLSEIKASSTWVFVLGFLVYLVNKDVKSSQHVLQTWIPPSLRSDLGNCKQELLCREHKALPLFSAADRSSSWICFSKCSHIAFVKPKFAPSFIFCLMTFKMRDIFFKLNISRIQGTELWQEFHIGTSLLCRLSFNYKDAVPEVIIPDFPVLHKAI